MKAKFLVGLLGAGLIFPGVSQAAWKFAVPTFDIYEPVGTYTDPNTVPAGPARDSLTAIKTKILLRADSVSKYALPKKFSETGFYSNWSTKAIDTAAKYFEVNSPLWSDGAHKTRWLILPPGQKIVFDEKTDYYQYPDGATFVKLFQHDTVPGDTTSRIWWETRVIIQKRNAAGFEKWYAYSYKWNRNGSEALLIPREETEDSALNRTFKIYPKGKNTPGHTKKWHYPSSQQCLVCHMTRAFKDQDSVVQHGRTILGFLTAQINRTPKGATANQITQFFDKGLFTWANKGTTKPSVAEIATFPKWMGLTDDTARATLNLRARSYMAANCSGCHGQRGNALGAYNSELPDYDFWDGKSHMFWAKRPVMNDFGVDGMTLLEPGQPNKSLIFFRQKARNNFTVDSLKWVADPTSSANPAKPDTTFNYPQETMPPLGVYEEDTVATKILFQWITNYDTTFDAVRSRISLHNLRAPIFVGRNILVPPELKGAVLMTTVDGRSLPLTKVSPTLYSVPLTVRPGIYFIRIGAKAYRQNLL